MSADRSESAWRRAWGALTAPRPVVRLETLRVLLPLAILGFMASRIVYTDEWIGTAGFAVGDLGGDWRQPFYLPRLPDWAAWSLTSTMVASGLAVAAGLRTRPAALIFAATLFWVALADGLSAFSVSKMAPVLMLALAASPAGARHGVDAWLAQRRQPQVAPVTHVSAGSFLFFPALLLTLYASSGICKARGAWLDTPYLLWSHLHGSYQTGFSHFLANALPPWSWNTMQDSTLAFEMLAPLWFALPWTRPFALAYGLGMHALIGLMFGPVIWFALLMMALLAACFLPASWLERSIGRLPG